MSNYTTGELAKLCGVSVRTVQYYDDRGILVPSALSEGGRRLYTEDDLRRMHVICFLRQIGLPINGISALFAEDNPKNIISVLLEDQEKLLKKELAECQEKLELIEGNESLVADTFGISAVAALAFLMFNLFSPPCFAAIGAMRAELKSGKWLTGAILLQLSVGYTVGFLTFFFGTLITRVSFGEIWMPVLGWTIVLLIATVITVLIVRQNKKLKKEAAK